jgi:8-oxoguanine deaminase
MARILLKNLKAAAVMKSNTPDSRDIDILIDNGIIKTIGKNIQADNCDLIDGSDCVALPGLVNTHHHFYQTLTRAIPRMQNTGLFQWLKNHYKIWEGIDEEMVYYGSLTAMGELLLTGCTLTTDHHYLFPESASKRLIDIQFQAAEELGIRFIATRGSMSVGESDGGLPPDSVIQTEKEILADSQRLIEAYHDPGPHPMKKIALAPCSPFSVSEKLMRDTADLARSYGVKIHTHLAETLDEEKYCIKRFGHRPVSLMQQWDWIGSDVWFAHCVHLNQSEIELFGETGTGVAHCPSSNMRLGSGIAPIRELVNAGAPVGLAVDGSASNDTSDILGEIRQCLLLQRVTKGAKAMKADTALSLATQGGAKLLGFEECGVLAAGHQADIALFNTKSLDFAGVHDPVAGLIFAGHSHRVDTVIIQGRIAVRHGRLVPDREDEIKENTDKLARLLLKKAEIKTGLNYLRDGS